MGRAVADIGECTSLRIRSELEWSHGRIYFPNGLNHLRILRFSLCPHRAVKAEMLN